MDVIATLTSAITSFENINPKYNNPGAIMDVGYYAQTKTYRPQQYASLADGQQALNDLVAKYIAGGHTVTSMFNKYAPSNAPEGNNTQAYIDFVSAKLGVDPNTKLSSLSTGNVGVTGASPTLPTPPFVDQSLASVNNGNTGTYLDSFGNPVGSDGANFDTGSSTSSFAGMSGTSIAIVVGAAVLGMLVIRS